VEVENPHHRVFEDQSYVMVAILYLELAVSEHWLIPTAKFDGRRLRIHFQSQEDKQTDEKEDEVNRLAWEKMKKEGKTTMVEGPTTIRVAEKKMKERRKGRGGTGNETKNEI